MARAHLPLERIDIVLAQPRRPGNIGAAARAMKNLGAGRLILVDPCNHLAPEALRMAYGAHDILHRARVTDTLPRAVARHRLVIGTTARAHKGYGEAAPIHTLRRLIVAHARRDSVAIVFGSEQNGLTNDELARCHRLVRLPMAITAPSYNLAQAVVLALYELFTAAQGTRLPRARPRATSSELEHLYGDWAALLAAIGFLKEQQGRQILVALRQIWGRADLDSRDVRILRGIARQMRWHRNACGQNGRKSTDSKKP